MKTWLKIIIVILGGCTTTSHREDAFCDIAQPISITHADILTQRLVEEIWQHDKTGKDLCGWTVIINSPAYET